MTDNQFAPERGILLLAKLAEAEGALLALPDSDRRNAELADIERLRKGIASRLGSTARGLTYYVFSLMADGGKLRFPDTRVIHEYKAVSQLSNQYGEPDNLICPLTDEVAAEMASAAFSDAHAWLYVKQVCVTELFAGRELPEILRIFAGLALLKPSHLATRGRKKTTNEVRDSTISRIGLGLKTVFRLPLSRGVGSTTDSVCSIISETMSAHGLSMSEDAIRKIIEKAGPEDQFPPVDGKK